jgi:hypothetical protein
LAPEEFAEEVGELPECRTLLALGGGGRHACPEPRILEARHLVRLAPRSYEGRANPTSRKTDDPEEELVCSPSRNPSFDRRRHVLTRPARTRNGLTLCLGTEPLRRKFLRVLISQDQSLDFADLIPGQGFDEIHAARTSMVNQTLSAVRGQGLRLDPEKHPRSVAR